MVVGHRHTTLTDVAVFLAFAPIFAAVWIWDKATTRKAKAPEPKVKPKAKKAKAKPRAPRKPKAPEPKPMPGTICEKCQAHMTVH